MTRRRMKAALVHIRLPDRPDLIDRDTRRTIAEAGAEISQHIRRLPVIEPDRLTRA